jgi:hypothetical protein
VNTEPIWWFLRDREKRAGIRAATVLTEFRGAELDVSGMQGMARAIGAEVENNLHSGCDLRITISAPLLPGDSSSNRMEAQGA